MKPRASAMDHAFCKASLVKVSRTFSKPIEMLPGELGTAVTCGYLLCRLADTVEDHPTLPLDQRDRLYDAFCGLLERDEPVDVFLDAYTVVTSDTHEDALARNVDRVLRVFGDLPERMQAGIVPWVCEMTRGMQIYSHRRVGEDGYTALLTVDDLERYCYFVAGTVGHMLTDLFVAACSTLTEAQELGLRRHSEAFGLGLQLTNILKDITDDRERGWSFIPRAAVRASGLTIANLTEPENRAAAHTALSPIFDRALACLDGAFDYCLCLPPEERAIRLFCLLPLWMAVRTLEHARGNDAQFEPGAAVKITRDEVGRLIQDCVARCQDDAQLRAGYSALAGTANAPV